MQALLFGSTGSRVCELVWAPGSSAGSAGVAHGLIAPRREGPSQLRSHTAIRLGHQGRLGRACQRLLVLFSVWVSEAADDVVCLNTDEVTLVQAVAICLFTSILGEIFDNRNLDRYSRGQSWRSLTVVCVSSKTWLSQFLPPPRAISVPLYPDLQNSPRFSSRALLCLKLCSTMQAADHTQVSAQAQPVALSLICKVKSYLAESLCSDWVMGHRW